MADKTGIEWTDATWSPITGCTRVSAGCTNCYIERTPPFRMNHRRFDGPGIGSTTGVLLHPERLDIPLRWRKPRRVFVCSMADLFHDRVPDEYIAKVFAVMALAPRHTFQVLTKRHGRMRSLLCSRAFYAAVYDALLGPWMDEVRVGEDILLSAMDWCGHLGRQRLPDPLPNLWLGVSAEDQQRADLRIPALLDTPAAVRFVSAEPLLGPIDLHADPIGKDSVFWVGHLDWVIVGGESGPGARPMHPDWARSLRDQCTGAGVAFLFKQWGDWVTDFARGTHLLQETGQLITRESGTTTNPYGHGSGVQDLVDRGHPGWVRVRRAGKKFAGRELDGRTWDEFPAGVTV